MMTVMIFHAQNCEVFIDGIRRVLIDVVEMKTDPQPLADAAALRVCSQKAIPLLNSWIDATHAKVTVGASRPASNPILGYPLFESLWTTCRSLTAPQFIAAATNDHSLYPATHR